MSRLRVGSAGLLLSVVSCGFSSSNEPPDVEPYQDPAAVLFVRVEPDCVLPSDPRTVIDDGGLVLKVWTFPLEEVHTRPVLPDDPGFLAYRAAIRAEGAEERYPALHVPAAVNVDEADVWRDEDFNNQLAYEEGSSVRR